MARAEPRSPVAPPSPSPTFLSTDRGALSHRRPGLPPWQGILPGWASTLTGHTHLMPRHLGGTAALQPTWHEAQAEMEEWSRHGDFRARRLTAAAQAPGFPIVKETLACFPGDDSNVKTNKQNYGAQHLNLRAQRILLPLPGYRVLGFRPAILLSRSCGPHSNLCSPRTLSIQASCSERLLVVALPSLQFWGNSPRPPPHRAVSSGLSSCHGHTPHPRPQPQSSLLSLPSWYFHFSLYILRRHCFGGLSGEMWRANTLP